MCSLGSPGTQGTLKRGWILPDGWCRVWTGCPGPVPPGTERNLFNGPPFSPWLATTEGGGGAADKDSLSTGLVSQGDRTRAKDDTTRRGSVPAIYPPCLCAHLVWRNCILTTTRRQLEHPGGGTPYAIRRGKEHPGPRVFPWVLQSPRAWATSLPPPAIKGVPARCSRPFMTRHSHALVRRDAAGSFAVAL